MSLIIKKMGIFYNKKSGSMEGMDLVRTHKDPINRHRDRVTLTEKGQNIMSVVDDFQNSFRTCA
ncbi:MAG TPA: winged helix-turn-helix transcriptional regulator [Desulfuromonadales bacterium]|nr:winged helix-turn-helix transcriptional regulator [Desulfuromonadales bacterium]